jgi:HAD superfamily hydrolase (TIGR01509 family)
MTFPFKKEDFDALIFDFGGVLYNIDYQLPIEAFKKLGIQEFDKIYTKTGQSQLIDDLETGRISGSTFLNELAHFFDKPMEESALLNAWNSILLDLPPSRIDLLKRLKSNYGIFLLSNTNELHADCFERQIDSTVGLASFRSAFDAIHYSHVFGMRKPHPETFKALCQLHDLNPQRCLFIDDSPQHVDGARKAGLSAYHFIVGEDDVEVLFKDW